jgi:hypothetical protein
VQIPSRFSFSEVSTQSLCFDVVSTQFNTTLENNLLTNMLCNNNDVVNEVVVEGWLSVQVRSLSLWMRRGDEHHSSDVKTLKIHLQREQGEWNEDNSGGCMAFPTWRDNPQYHLTYEGSGKATICLSQGDQAQANIGFYVYDLKEGQGKLIR